MRLICDDDKAVHSTLSVVLKRAGYEVENHPLRRKLSYLLYGISIK